MNCEHSSAGVLVSYLSTWPTLHHVTKGPQVRSACTAWPASKPLGHSRIDLAQPLWAVPCLGKGVHKAAN